jgi:S1-C subfamily serine protease
MLRKSILLFLIFATILSFSFFASKTKRSEALADIMFQEQIDTLSAIEKVKVSVVSVVSNQELTSTIFNKENGEIKIDSNITQTSGGSGIIVSADGLIITNKHVVSDEEEYSVILNNGDIYNAKIVATDPLEDLALIKIEAENLKPAVFSNSRNLKVGHTVMAIGYSMGRYKNSVSKGIISGLNRDLIAASPDGKSVHLSNIIQTDAAINKGNSGGALVNLNGEVVGINSAVETVGENIGFAILSNVARKAINSYKIYEKIKRPKLGVRYIMLDSVVAKYTGLPRKDGAWIHSGNDDPAVVPDAPGDIAGLKENDIIFEVNAIKVTEDLPLAEIVNFYEPGQTIGFKVQRGEKIIILQATLDSFE